MLNSKLLKKGSSLIEVIIVLAIVSFTIIASMALVARTRLEIRNNEIQDNANGVLLKALEALKTPAKVVINGNPSLSGANAYYFSLKEDTAGRYILQYQAPGSFKSLPGESGTFDFNDVCTTDNPFYVSDGSFTYCQQVTITPILRPGVIRELYEVGTRIIYTTSNENKSESLTSYRYANFE